MSISLLPNYFISGAFPFPKGGGRTEHYGKVHSGNKSRKFCTETAAHKKYIDNKRKRKQRSEAKRRERVEACQSTRMKPLTSYFTSQTNTTPTLPYDPWTDNAVEDDALLGINEELDAALNDAQRDGDSYIATTATDRDRVQHLQKCLLAQADNSSKRYVLACAYAKFEESIRHGRTELQSGRFVAEHFFTDERDNRINGCRSCHQWYRRRARSLIVGYRHFIATGTLLPETRGKCGGKSIIHDTGVQNLCRETIAQDLPLAWSARQFREKISCVLCTFGYIADGSMIGRDTATYWLHILGYTLACPKKGIYKDGHERRDVVVYRKEYTATLLSYKNREHSYTGTSSDEFVPRTNTTHSEIIRIYHDECIYASSEGALSLWVPDGKDPLYKKPRGHIIMCSGFICRCHGMMRVPKEEQEAFFIWSGKTKAAFPMSCKIYVTPDVTCTRYALEENMLCSFTTIVPGSGKGKDDYWDNDDMCEHLDEVALIAKWVHRQAAGQVGPELYFIFDGSSNHAARSPDARHVGAGIETK
jgi:hypothetical protein